MEGSRTFLDPEHETEITVREIPVELSAGVSRRLKSWAFFGPRGDFIVSVPVHRTSDLDALSEVELEMLYLFALENC